MSEEFSEYDDEMDDEESEEFDFDCGAMYGPKGEPMGCSKAGSEDCDWECPYVHQVERELRAQYAANVRWAKKKDSTTQAK